MKSIEIIEIRLTRNLNEVIETEIGNIIKEVMNEESGYTMKLYNKMQVKSDYMILIFHTQKLTNRKQSQIGLRLKESLKDFGMINHSVWNELL